MSNITIEGDRKIIRRKGVRMEWIIETLKGGQKEVVNDVPLKLRR